MMRAAQFFLFIVLLFAVSPKVFSQEMIELSGRELHYPMGRAISYYQDATRQKSFEEVSLPSFAANYLPASKDVLNFGMDTSIYWIRFRARDLSSPPHDWIFWIDFPLLDHVEIYEQAGDGSLIRKQEMGMCLPFSNRPIEYVNFAIPLQFQYSQPTTFYIKVDSKKPKILPMSILDKDIFYKEKSYNDLWYGLFFGVLLVMILYNSFVSYALRDRSYLHYTLSIIATALFFLGTSGYGYQYLWQNHYEFNNISNILFACFLVLTSGSFSQSFLKLRTKSKWLHHILTGLMVISALCAIALFILEDAMPINIAMYITISAQIVFLLISGIVVWKQGYRPAMFFTIAWTGYLIGGLMLSFVNWSLLSYNFFTRHAAEAGAGLMVVLLSLALSESYRLLKREKEEASQAVIKMQEGAKQVLEDKVRERTAELTETNEELNQIVEELNVTNDRLNELNGALSKRDKNITDSLNYAKRIQSAILPFSERINKVVDEHFILFRPRDIVSGDFYWFLEHEDKIFIAAVDCTGHGVPGAFMSLLGHDALNNTVISQGITEADKILTYLNLDIRTILQQDRTANKDGMDMTICVIDPDKQTMEFAGAKNPLLYFQDGESRLIKGDKFSVGGRQLKHMKRFTKTQIDISKATSFYLFSDGFQDQFGGEHGRKFLTKNFRALIEKNQDRPMSLQKTILEEALENWMGTNHKQIDDILVMGFRITKRFKEK